MHWLTRSTKSTHRHCQTSHRCTHANRPPTPSLQSQRTTLHRTSFASRSNAARLEYLLALLPGYARPLRREDGGLVFLRTSVVRQVRIAHVPSRTRIITCFTQTFRLRIGGCWPPLV